MRNKVAKIFNRWARTLELSKNEKRQLKKDWTKDPKCNIMELKQRYKRVEELSTIVEEPRDEETTN